ncbi:ketoacyl-synthetase C-terminal extension domain-containing protein, partial [Streptomyces sp. W16]|uniref:ketoacyl-synthetase C-terminal extension domain-containing protein n=1 Tax=Streptomyces sp. W16 TaxID=3076631 RepID=UPI00295BA707
ALGAALGTAHSAAAPLLIGSVKSNLGHLEGAAGLAGVVKTVLALHHAKLPPTLHYARPNPAVAMDELGLRVVDRLQDWPSGPGDRLAGVSSFGFGGTNAHAVLAGAPATGEVMS